MKMKKFIYTVCVRALSILTMGTNGRASRVYNSLTAKLFNKLHGKFEKDREPQGSSGFYQQIKNTIMKNINRQKMFLNK